MLRLGCLGLLTALLLGCGNNHYFSDDEGGPRQEGSVLSEHPDELSLPYAQGTKVRIAIQGGDKEDMSAWQIRSDTPAVFTVDRLITEDQGLSAECTAGLVGQARIRLFDRSGEIRAAVVSVRAPDRARLFAHGPLRVLGRDEVGLSRAEVSEARILTGGKGVFAVAYFEGAQRLYGRGIAVTEQPAQVKVENQTTRGVVSNEWLFISPEADGTHELRLRHGERTLLTVPVMAVPETDLATLTLSQEVGERKQDQQVWVVTQIMDRTGREVYGVYYTWTLGGVMQMGKDDKAMETAGDLYRYNYAADVAPRELQATRGALSATTTIQASKGYLANTTYLGCTMGRGPAPAAPVIGLLALLLLALRRRRA